jgi:hypothetical protein
VQVPAPSHLPIGVNDDPLHDGVPQLVPFVAYRQAPEPSQVPLNPQGGLELQPLCGSMSPAGTGVQRPASPGTLHE